MNSARLDWGTCFLLSSLVLFFPITFAATDNDSSSCKDLTGHENWPLLSDVGCGRGSAGGALSSRIYRGEEAELGEYPWLARLMYKDVNGTAYVLCGGSIINNRYVLTAAHCCLANLTLDHVTVGEYDTETEVDCKGEVCAPPALDVAVESFVVHPGFDKKQLEFDICLVRLSEPLVFTDFVRPACLPFNCTDQKDNLIGTKLEIAGFGIMANSSAGFKVATVLQKTVQEAVPLDRCRKMWTGVFEISDAEVCTLAYPFVSQACFGDSGGPVVALSSPKEPIVVGIISHGWSCFLSAYYGAVPSVNIKVSAYLSWILDNVRA